MHFLYYYSKLNIGGAERSTVRLLNRFVQHGHQVTLLLRWSGGALESDLDPRLNVVHLKFEPQNNRFPRLNHIVESIKYYVRIEKLKQESYDVAISGLFGYDPKLLFTKIRAKQYYQLLRNDVEKTGTFGKTEQYMQQYGDCFDAYIGVSHYTTESFVRCYPQYAAKATTIYNILPDVDVEKELASESPYPEEANKLRIVTVCRLADQAKGLFRMVSICRKLFDAYGDVFRWYVVGKGPDEAAMKAKIQEAGLQSVMILSGETNNPFPYYVHADLVAVLSYNEGLCGVVNEAKLMHRPVLATRFSGIDEQIESGENGIIVDNDEMAILDAMRRILSDPSSLLKMHNNEMPEDLLDNDKKIEQYVNLFEKLKGVK